MYVKKAVKGVTVRQQVQSHSLFRKSEKYQLNRPLWLSQYPPRKIWQWLKNMIVDDDDDNNNWERTSTTQYGRRTYGVPTDKGAVHRWTRLR